MREQIFFAVKSVRTSYVEANVAKSLLKFGNDVRQKIMSGRDVCQ